MVEAELNALNAAEAETRRHAAKTARADETRRQVKELTAQLSKDEESLTRIAAKEKRVEAAQGEAERRGKKMMEMFDAQLEAARRLAATQQQSVENELKAAAEAAGKTAGAQDDRLVDQISAFVKKEHAAALKQVERARQTRPPRPPARAPWR